MPQEHGGAIATVSERHAACSQCALMKTTTSRRTSKPATRTASKSTKAKSTSPAKKAVKKVIAKVAPAKKSAKKSPAKKSAVAKSDRERIHDLLEDFPTVMLVTAEHGGASPTLRARPMSVAKLGDDCSLTFMTSIDTSKVDEAKKDINHVVAQGRTTFLSLSGDVEIVRDRARIHEAWKPVDKVYFPEGADDPKICLLVFRPTAAELWDLSGAKGIRYLFEAARALLSGERPQHDPSGDTHERVALSA